MIDDDFKLLLDNPDWQLVLAAYAAHVAAEAAQAENSGPAAQPTPPVVENWSDEAAASAEGCEAGEADEDEATLVGWIPRLRRVDEVPHDRLASIHGKLIALGFLKFQIRGRSDGVVYRPTPEARAALSRLQKAATAAETRDAAPAAA